MGETRGSVAGSDQDATEPLTPQSPQWQLLPRSAQSRSWYVGWVRPAFLCLYAGVPFSLFILCWDNGVGNRQDDLRFAWTLLAVSLGPAILALLFFVNRFRQRQRGRRVFPPLRPLGEPQPHGRPAGVRYPLRSADLRIKNMGRILAASLLAALGLVLFFGARGGAKHKPGVGFVQWYGGAMVLVGAGLALWVVIAWFRGVGRSSFAVVASPDGVWLPPALRREPVFWEDVADFQRQSLELSYRARPEWDAAQVFLPWKWQTEECEVDVLAILEADGETAVCLPLDELADPDRFVRQLTALWQNPQVRAELADPNAVTRLQSLSGD